MNLADYGMDENTVNMANDFVENFGKNETMATAEMIKTAFIMLGDISDKTIGFILESYAAAILYTYMIESSSTVEKLFGGKLMGEGEENAN